MQYVGRAFDSVSKTWSSINPATLSGAIDVIVVEHPDGELACSPFHVRFGKFQILKPSQKKVEVIVNGHLTDIPMKLGDSGEAYFVFETLAELDDIPEELISSPVASAASSPETKPHTKDSLEEPDFLDINEAKIERPATPTRIQRITKRLTQREIPSTVDNNGDLLLDIEGYKTSKNKVNDTNELLKQLLHDELGEDIDLSEYVREDEKGNIRIVNPEDSHWANSPPNSPPMTSSDSLYSEQQSIVGDSSSHESTPSVSTDTTKSATSTREDNSARYIKTIRLTSKQLKCLDLSEGENDLVFSVDKGRALVSAKLFYWKWDDPIVISDIDGTITKSDALGHVMTMIGKDWTHPGVAKLFTEIRGNGYNIMYLTARTAGQSDSTRSYLRSIVQDGCTLPIGPVILSPDRTIAALRREVILKKPEVFKIACLKDMKALYFPDSNDHGDDSDEIPTPFIAGFGNRITDALSYRAVGIPSSRIFTINPDGEVHMELLELAGYKSSYIHINELVDHFFPPVKKHPMLVVDDARSMSTTPGSPYGTHGVMTDEKSFYRANDDKYSDVNFWREPIPDLDDLSDLDEEETEKQETEKQKPTPWKAPINETIRKANKSVALSSISNNKKTIKQVENYNKSNEDEDDDKNDNIKNKNEHINNHEISATESTSRRTSDVNNIGQRMYLDLGSPLSSPIIRNQDSDLDLNLSKIQDDTPAAEYNESSPTPKNKAKSMHRHSSSEKSILTLDHFSKHTPSTLEMQPVNVYNDGAGPVMDRLQLDTIRKAGSRRSSEVVDPLMAQEEQPLHAGSIADSDTPRAFSDNDSSQTEIESENNSDDEYEDEFDEDEDEF